MIMLFERVFTLLLLGKLEKVNDGVVAVTTYD